MRNPFNSTFFNRVKKIGIVSFAALVIVMTSLTPSRADMNSDISEILIQVRNISNTTAAMLSTINRLLTGVNNIGIYLLNIIQADTSPETGKLQNTLATLSDELKKNTNVNGDLQNNLLINLLGSKKLPAHDTLLYSNMFIPNSPYAVDYISNVGGLKTKHYSPETFEYKDDASKNSYTNFYNSVMSISSFNAYVLSSMGSENNLNQIQEKLISEAGDSNWFKKIMTDPISNILRRILMYQSEQFLFFNELIKVQKQLLYAQVMTNTLLINYGKTNEAVLIRDSIKR